MKKFLILCLILFCAIVANPCYAIKVGLSTQIDTTFIGSSTSAQIINTHSNKLLYTMNKMKGYEFRAYRDNVAIKIQGKYFNLGTDSIVIKPADGGYMSTKQKWYRGFFMVQNHGGKLVVINNLNIDDYVQGVVPSEMPSSWAYEAHKAQAIAARSYALANLGKRAQFGYDLKDTPEDQAYRGATGETAQTNRAVQETKGIVLIYDMKIIPAYYSASAGGHTANASEVWTRDLPYIKSVPSFDGNVKKNGHGIGMSQHGANNLAKQGYNAYQILQYFYKNIKFARINQEFYQ